MSRSHHEAGFGGIFGGYAGDEGMEDDDSDSSDKEDAKYDDGEWDDDTQREKMLGRMENYKACKCQLCLNNVRFVEKNDNNQKIIKALVQIPEQSLKRMERDVSAAILNGSFQTTACMQVADYFNNTVVPAVNSMMDGRIQKKLTSMSASQIYNHYLNHIKTPQNMVFKQIDRYDTIMNDLYNRGGMVRDHKIKKSGAGSSNRKKRKHNDQKIEIDSWIHTD